MNILVSTTKQWNPGDEFIFYGVKNLFEEIIPNVNWVIYDRNPDVLGHKKHVSNTWKSQRDLDFIDCFVAAGSPQWFGGSMKPLYEKLNKINKKIIFLGVGTSKTNIPLTSLDIEILKRTSLITTRDRLTKHNIKQQSEKDSELKVCPAFFASKSCEIRTKNKIGFCLQVDKGHQKISKTLMEESVKLAKEIGGTIICHYLDDFEYFNKKFSDVRYSGDSIDYLDIYREFDVIISTRLHGAILAHSLGIPSFVLTEGDDLHATRCNGAVDMFPHIIACSPGEVIKKLQNLMIQETSEKIIDFKNKEKNSYLSLIKKHM